jgi:hypothetical protein
MKKIIQLFFVSLFFVSCAEKQQTQKVTYNQVLANQLEEMAKVDQVAAYIRVGEYKKWSLKKWNAFKDSVFTTNKKKLKKIYAENGYPGFDLVGEKGEQNFWLMTQHCDDDPEFQLEILKALEKQVQKKNADARNYGLLTDRVNLNIGKKQVYGTQVSYRDNGQAHARNLKNSAKVDQLREEIGLEPLEEYLNQMTLSHFEMNKELFIKNGIKSPTLYKVKNENNEI